MESIKRLTQIIATEEINAIQRGIKILERYAKNGINKVIIGGDNAKNISPLLRSYCFKREDLPELFYYCGKIPENSLKSPNCGVIYCS